LHLIIAYQNALHAGCQLWTKKNYDVKTLLFDLLYQLLKDNLTKYYTIKSLIKPQLLSDRTSENRAKERMSGGWGLNLEVRV